MSRSHILGRLDRLEWEGPDLPDLPAGAEGADPVWRFVRAAGEAGAIVGDGRGGRLEECLQEVLRVTGAEEIYWEDEEALAGHGIEYRLRDPRAFQDGKLVYSLHPNGRPGFPLLLHSRPRTGQHLERIGLSAASATRGVADTGTLLHETGAGRGRLLSILPPAHLFLLRVSDVVADAAALFESWTPSEASLATLVTGPSRTADIEKTLVIGVHGPRQCLVILTGS